MTPADLANAERVANMKAARRAELKAEAERRTAEEATAKAAALKAESDAVLDCLKQLGAEWLFPLRMPIEPDRWSNSDTGEKFVNVPFHVPGHRGIRMVMTFVKSGATGYWAPSSGDVLPWAATGTNYTEYFDTLADALICAEITEADRENDLNPPIPF